MKVLQNRQDAYHTTSAQGCTLVQRALTVLLQNEAGSLRLDKLRLLIGQQAVNAGVLSKPQECRPLHSRLLGGSCASCAG